MHTMNIELHKVLSSVRCVNIVLYQKKKNAEISEKQHKYLVIKKLLDYKKIKTF